MTTLKFKPWGPQKELLMSVGKPDEPRIKVMIAAKRSGKSEPAYIETIMKGELQPNYVDNGVDPFMMAIVAPTNNMLSTLVFPKFRAFAAPFEENFGSTKNLFEWKGNNTILHGVSAEKIKRLEGKKLHHVHITEVFQMDRNVFLEVLARVSDSQGTITIDGSLGPDIINPKQHWVYKEFVEKKWPGAKVWQWNTDQNPHFPQEELEYMREVLDPMTFRSMFQIDWDTIPSSAVYADFCDENVISGYIPNPDFDTYISVDFGWTHPAVALFLQHDPVEDVIYLYDEIVKSKLTIDQLFNAIMLKVSQHQAMAKKSYDEHFQVTDYICDIAGNQEREQTGKSNVAFFKKRGIFFKRRSTAITFGIPIIRSFIKDGLGRRKFFVDETRCPKSIDGIKRYHYPEKDGIITAELPAKKDDDVVDALRYFAVNILDKTRVKSAFTDFKVV